jgi:2-(3-amino-3-carboxypropyl)histidine synthase
VTEIDKSVLRSNLKKLAKSYKLELDEIIKIVLEKGYTAIGLQLPEGLKIYAETIKDHIEDRIKKQGQDLTLIISGEPCYGACDLVGDQYKQMGVEAIFHFGHAELPNLGRSEIPAYFIQTASTLELKKVLDKVINYIKKHKKELGSNPKIGLITTVQHIHLLKKAMIFLDKNKFKTFIGKGDNRIKYDGQVLGCNFSAATSITKKVDFFIFIGSGNFHPLGVALATGQKVIIADPYTNEVRDIKKIHDTIMRQRGGAIARAMDANAFGILISIKPGQNRQKLAMGLKDLIREHNKRSYLIALNEFEPVKLKAFKVDTFVSTGCPRIAIDDYLKYDVPILTPVELEIVLGEKNWDQYEFDQILAND